MRIVEVETSEPSPFAKSLLFGYVGAFVYEGDVPLAEKKAAALSLDAGLLAELLGKDGLKQLLDPAVIAGTEADLQGLSEERQAHGSEQLFDLIRTTGPFTADRDRRPQRAASWTPNWPSVSCSPPAGWCAVRIAGADCFAVVEDIARLRDGLGHPGSARGGGRIRRAGRAPGPRSGAALGAHPRTVPGQHRGAPLRLGGLGRRGRPRQLIRQSAVVPGSFSDDLIGAESADRPAQLSSIATEATVRQYCHQKVLALIKRRTLALLRKSVEPVEQSAFARFLPEWQGVGAGARGVDALVSVLEQLAGYPLPASSIESVVLPARIANYAPAMLDELTTSR